MKKYQFLTLSLLTVLPAFFAGCGGGGGGGGGSDSVDIAARVFLSVSPATIDTGDRTTVSVLIEQVNSEGAAIKVRFPVGMSYILGSSELEVDGELSDIAPTSNVSDETNGYLVYYLRQSTVGDDSAVLTLKLLGTAAVKKGLIEVDADIDDPALDNQSEFQVATPNFAAEDSDTVVVKG